MNILDAINDLSRITESEDSLYTRQLNKSVNSIAAAYNLIINEVNRLNISDSTKKDVREIVRTVETLTNSIDVGQLDLKNISVFMQKTNLTSIVSVMQFVSLFSSPDEINKLVSDKKDIRIDFKPGANIRGDALKILSLATVDNLAEFRPTKHSVATGIGEILTAVIYKGGALASSRGDITIGDESYEIKTDDGTIYPLNEQPYLYKTISEMLAATNATGSRGNTGSGVRDNFKNEVLSQEQLDKINELGAEINVHFNQNMTQQGVFDALFKLALNTYLKNDEKILLTNATSKDPKLDKSAIITNSDTAASLAARGIKISFSDNRNLGKVFKIKLR